MKKRSIKKIAVLGSGIMGSGIACHFANIGVPVLLLDIPAKDIGSDENSKGLTPKKTAARNRIVNDNLQKALRLSPPLLYHQDFSQRIQTGNLEDDIHKIKDVDWIIEAVTERLDIKKSLFEKVESHRASGALISSNTSGIPIHLIAAGRSEDFRKNFCGTHFFNPPRYLKLLEIIPTAETNSEIIDFLMDYGTRFLGKTTVLCKDTPAFIANRIGLFSIMNLLGATKELELSVEEVDQLTGPIIGRPKSATFRTIDVVGLDILAHVAEGLFESLQNDEQKQVFQLPDFIQKMLQNNQLGAKTDQGFYKKTKNQDGDTEILALDLNTLRYRPQQKISMPILEKARTIEKISDRFKVLIESQDKYGTFYQKTLAALFSYVSHRIGEISDEIYKIDDAMRAGFGWEQGPFQIWDILGVKEGCKLIEAEGYSIATWVEDMLAKDINTFYRIYSEGKSLYYDLAHKRYTAIPRQETHIVLDHIRPSKTVWENAGAAIEDLGDGILNLEFRSKMNTIGGEVLEGVHRAIDLAEKEFEGLVIANQATHFSVGANLAMVMMMAAEREWDELNATIQTFQNALMRIRYSSIPVVIAPHGMTLGGGCEIVLHADKVIAAAETYIGLVEFGVGLIPAGGGVKELTLRTTQRFEKGDVELNRLRESFLNIATAKVSGSAYEAYEMKILQRGQDLIVVNQEHQIISAKAHARLLAQQGYTQPIAQKIKVLGQQALGMFLVGSDSMLAGGYISEHDRKIANKLAYVMSGGDLSEPTLVSEQYLLDLEREAFLSLCGEKKTLERIQHMLKTGKSLRN